MRQHEATLWGHQDFLRLWAAQAVSAFGSRITRTALPILAIVLVAASPIDVAVLGALEVLPAIAVGLFAAGWIDRSKKRGILIAADLTRALCVVSVPVAAWLADVTIFQLYVIAGLVGAASAVFRLADNAYLPTLIGRKSLIEGNSKLETTESIAEIGGPGFAGVLIQLLTAPFAMLFDAATYLWSALLLSRIRVVELLPPRQESTPSIAHDIRTGVKAGFGDARIGPTLWAIALSDLFGGFFLALYMLYTLNSLGISVATIGIIIALGGVGALAGALLAARVSKRLGLGRAMIAMLALAKLSALLIPLAGMYPHLKLPLLATNQLFGDAFMVAFLILATSFRQAVLPQDVMARANGMLQVMSGVLLPSGALIAGGLATVTSVDTAIWIGVVGGLGAVVPLLRPAIRRLESMPDGATLRAHRGATL